MLAARQRPDAARVRELLAKAREMHGTHDGRSSSASRTWSSRSCWPRFSRRPSRSRKRSTGRAWCCSRRSTSPTAAPTSAPTARFAPRNTELTRRTLTQEEIAEETRILIRQGHKRVLMVAGEALPDEGFQYILDSIATIYATQGWARRDPARQCEPGPAAAWSASGSSKEAQIGTFQLFQETYHRPTYAAVHLKGRKRDYDWRDHCLRPGHGSGHRRRGHGRAVRALRLAL